LVIQLLPGDRGAEPILGALSFSQRLGDHSSLCG
jgi:hypothetical protein